MPQQVGGFHIIRKNYQKNLHRLKKNNYIKMKSGLKLNLIAAACDNMGIGFKGDLPWHLK